MNDLVKLKIMIHKSLEINWAHIPAKSIGQIDFYNLSDEFISGIKAGMMECSRQIDRMIEADQCDD